MAKTKPRADVTDADIEAAIARGKNFERYAPHAVKAIYRKSDDMVQLTLSTGVEVAIPRRLMQGLRDAKSTDVAQIEILGPGSTLHWSRLDVQHGLASLLKGVFGNRRWMAEIGRHGGSAQTEAKRAAARENGRKGGRPRKNAA